jgi:hypothetical protein
MAAAERQRVVVMQRVDHAEPMWLVYKLWPSPTPRMALAPASSFPISKPMQASSSAVLA